jgi:hypothetical protein
MTSIMSTDTLNPLPTVSYGSFVTALDKFHEAGGAPTEIHNSAFDKSTFNGSTIALLVKAFRSLDLSDEKNVPRERLDQLIEPKTRKDAIANLLRDRYKTLIALPLDKANPNQFNKWFDDCGMAAEDTRKAKTFFLHAAKANGVSVSKYITDQHKTRTPAPRSKAKGKGKSGTAPLKPKADDADDDSQTPEVSVADKILALYPPFNPEWPADTAQKWFDGLAKLQDQLIK